MNYSILTQVLTKEQIDQFERRYPAQAGVERGKKIIKTLFIVFGGIFVFFGLQSLLFALFTEPGIVVSSLFLFLFTAFFWGSAWYMGYSSKKQQQDSARIALFAEQNGLEYVRVFDNPNYTGMFFGLGHSRALSDVIVSRHSDVKYEIGNYTYTVGGGKHQHTYTIGYIRIATPRHLPQIVLDASSNNARIFGGNISNLPATFDKDQKMRLEGDFDKHFTLYAPKEYQQDALYIFTPDLMALMIDNTKAYDSELVDNQMFIYNSQVPFKLTDGLLLERLFKIVEAVGVKTDTQTDQYADARIGDRSRDEVAVGGKRLKRRLSVFAVIVFIFIIAGFFGPFILSFFE